MLYFLIMLAVIYSAVLVMMYGLQRFLLYHPFKKILPPSEYGLTGFEELTLNAADGVKLQAWYSPAKPGMPSIAYFHGNAFHLGNRARIYQALADKGFGVLATSYRGYGKSEGTPTEQGLYMDARAAIALLSDKGMRHESIILYGESLGTGVATQMASEYPVGGLVLQSPYTAVEDRAAELYRIIPVHLLSKDKYRSIDKIGKVRAPVMIFHGEKDDTIPVAHGRRMLEAANQPKEAYFFGDINHNDFDTALISEHVLTFARKYGLIS